MNESLINKTEQSILKVTYPKDSVGKDMTDKVPVAHPGQSIEIIKNSLHEYARTCDSINYVYVVTDKKKLVGVASIKEILKDESHKVIDEIMVKELVTTHVQVNRKRVAHLAIKHNIKAVPVLDQEKNFLGVLTSDTLLSILHKEHRAEMNRTAGIVSIFDTILEQGIWHSFVSRLPWILIGMIGGIFSAKVIELFQVLLSGNIILAVFIPLIVYIGNAVGAQTQTFFVRDIAFEPKIKMFPYFMKQFVTASLIGLICGIFIWALVTLFWQSSYIGFVIGLSAFTAVSLSTCIAILIPYLFSKFKRDPATGSGPFATILQDLTSISIYFLIASVLF